MQKQYFSTIFEDKFNGGHYLVVSAAETAHQALADGQRHLEQHHDIQPTPLGTFAGALEPQLPYLPQGHALEHMLTKSARRFDLEQAHPLMMEWSSLDFRGISYVASVSPPEEMENTLSPETLTLNFEDGKWWLGDSCSAGQNDFLFLKDAIEAGNESIAEIEADFRKSVAEVA